MYIHTYIYIYVYVYIYMSIHISAQNKPGDVDTKPPADLRGTRGPSQTGYHPQINPGTWTRLGI